MKYDVASFAFLIAGSVSANTNEWYAVYPGGNTGCAKGGDYAFMFREGAVNKLVIDFEGGGACWDAATCALPMYTQSVNAVSKVNSLNSNSGLQSGTNPANPFSEYAHLFVPYCTGDAFAGNSTKNYGLLAGQVSHLGRPNALAAIEYAKRMVPNPESVVSTGCSAGSLGAIVHLPYIMGSAFQDAKHYSWHDSFVGVLAQGQYEGGRDNWPMALHVDLAPELGSEFLDPWDPDMGTRIIQGTAKRFPDLTLTHFTYNADLVQTGFYLVGGGLGGGSFTDLMRKEVADLTDTLPENKYKYYIASGASHCVTQSSVYTIEEEGVRLVDWIEQIINDEDAEQSVDCCREDDTTPAERAASTTKALDAMPPTAREIAAAYLEQK